MAKTTFYTVAEAKKSPEKVKRLAFDVKSRRQKLPDFSIFPNLEEVSIHGREHIRQFPASLFRCTRLREIVFLDHLSGEVLRARRPLPRYFTDRAQPSHKAIRAALAGCAACR